MVEMGKARAVLSLKRRGTIGVHVVKEVIPRFAVLDSGTSVLMQSTNPSPRGTVRHERKKKNVEPLQKTKRITRRICDRHTNPKRAENKKPLR